MIFNEYAFLFVFLPLVLAGFFLPALRSFRLYTLLAASFVFYGLSGLDHVAVLIGEIVLIHVLTRQGPQMKTWQYATAVAFPLLVLFYFKYSAFFFDQFTGGTADGTASHQSFSLFQNIILPAGISFFTFQLISFACDRRSGQIAKHPMLPKMALYISFFPQLVAGPILRYEQVHTAIDRLRTFRLGHGPLAEGVGFIVFGLAAKVLLADGLADCLAPMIAEPGALRGDALAFTVLGYSFQIYFDFYGYSLIAIGVGRLFGFDFPDNFNRPYEALNPREFWRRWHVTLSYWLRDYVYVRLGGNRNYIRNIIIVFALCGLWHGAGWTFVLWGLYHALLVVCYHVTARFWDTLPGLVQRLATFSLVSVGWLLFAFDFNGLTAYSASLAAPAQGTVGVNGAWAWGLLLISATVCFFVHFEKLAAATETRPLRRLAYSAGLAVLMMLAVLLIDQSHTFIYFRF